MTAAASGRLYAAETAAAMDLSGRIAGVLECVDQQIIGATAAIRRIRELQVAYEAAVESARADFRRETMRLVARRRG